MAAYYQEQNKIPLPAEHASNTSQTVGPESALAIHSTYSNLVLKNEVDKSCAPIPTTDDSDSASNTQEQNEEILSKHASNTSQRVGSKSAFVIHSTYSNLVFKNEEGESCAFTVKVTPRAMSSRVNCHHKQENAVKIPVIQTSSPKKSGPLDVHTDRKLLLRPVLARSCSNPNHYPVMKNKMCDDMITTSASGIHLSSQHIKEEAGDMNVSMSESPGISETNSLDQTNVMDINPLQNDLNPDSAANNASSSAIDKYLQNKLPNVAVKQKTKARKKSETPLLISKRLKSVH